MTDRELQRLMQEAPLPGEVDAQQRALVAVHVAFARREPVTWPRRRSRPLLAAAAVLAVLAAAVSPPGQAVLGEVREAIGRERVVGVPRSQLALFSLPAPGRLLVESRRGAWVVNQDGSRRLLGRYREASWSPGGKFVVATRRDELLAIDPRGNLRWSLPRQAVSLPRWAPSGFRIAYRSGAALRVVAGDGSGDRPLELSQPVAPAWRPGARHLVAFGQDGRVEVVDADTGRMHWSSEDSAPSPSAFAWSDDGRWLLAVSPFTLSKNVAGSSLHLVTPSRRSHIARELAGQVVAVAFQPRTHLFMVARVLDQRSQVLLFDANRFGAPAQTLFSGKGRFSGAEWSPNGRRLLVGWESADQWVFVDVQRPTRVVAVSDITRQFNPGAGPTTPFPRVSGWCCR